MLRDLLIWLRFGFSATEDTTVSGYLIPKGYHVYVNMYAIHTDSKYWKAPQMFDPERFLDTSKSKLIKRDSFIPFSTG